jgi:hypothetical protein
MQHKSLFYIALHTISVHTDYRYCKQSAMGTKWPRSGYCMTKSLFGGAIGNRIQTIA